MNRLRLTHFMLATGAMLIALFGLTTSCSNHSEKSHCVTYVASSHSFESCELCITYQDSNGIEIFYTDQETWSKEVCLPPRTSAFLMVRPMYRDPNLPEVMFDLNWPEDSPNGVVAKISSGKSTTLVYGINLAVAVF